MLEMENKRYYNTEEAIQKILALNSDSELSDIELSDDDDALDNYNQNGEVVIYPT